MSVAATTAVAGGRAAADTRGLAKETPVLQGEAALRADAMEYASQYTTSVDEALERLRLQGPIAELEATLRANEENQFGGLVIEHEPAFRIRVLLTDGDAAVVDRYVTDDRLRGLAEVTRVSHTLLALESELVDVLAVRTSTRRFDAEVDVRRNRIIVGIARPTGPELRDEADHIRAAARERGRPLSGAVHFRSVPELAQPALDIFGGLRLEAGGPFCTSGFSVRHNGTGATGVTTAAHCANSMSYAGYSLTFEAGNLSGSYDIQWHSRSGANFPNKIYKGDGVYLLITGKVARASQPIGAFVCKSGVTTHKTCGEIETKNYAPSWVPSAAGTFIAVVNNLCSNMIDGGDSGGPVWIGSDAWGTSSGYDSGGGCERLIYMASNYVEGGLNVSIRTG